MNEAIHNAQASLDHFIAALQSPSPTQTVFQIKGRLPYDGDGYAEHMWVQDVTFDGDRFVGTLGNEPVFIQDGLHYGDQVTASPNDVTDWIIVDSGKMLGGFTVHVLRNRLSDTSRRDFDAESGLISGDHPLLP